MWDRHSRKRIRFSRFLGTRRHSRYGSARQDRTGVPREIRLWGGNGTRLGLTQSPADVAGGNPRYVHRENHITAVLSNSTWWHNPSTLAGPPSPGTKHSILSFLSIPQRRFGSSVPLRCAIRACITTCCCWRRDLFRFATTSRWGGSPQRPSSVGRSSQIKPSPSFP